MATILVNTSFVWYFGIVVKRWHVDKIASQGLKDIHIKRFCENWPKRMWVALDPKCECKFMLIRVQAKAWKICILRDFVKTDLRECGLPWTQNVNVTLCVCRRAHACVCVCVCVHVHVYKHYACSVMLYFVTCMFPMLLFWRCGFE